MRSRFRIRHSRNYRKKRRQTKQRLRNAPSYQRSRFGRRKKGFEFNVAQHRARVENIPRQKQPYADSSGSRYSRYHPTTFLSNLVGMKVINDVYPYAKEYAKHYGSKAWGYAKSGVGHVVDAFTINQSGRPHVTDPMQYLVDAVDEDDRHERQSRYYGPGHTFYSDLPSYLYEGVKDAIISNPEVAIGTAIGAGIFASGGRLPGWPAPMPELSKPPVSIIIDNSSKEVKPKDLDKPLYDRPIGPEFDKPLYAKPIGPTFDGHPATRSGMQPNEIQHVMETFYNKKRQVALRRENPYGYYPRDLLQMLPENKATIWDNANTGGVVYTGRRPPRNQPQLPPPPPAPMPIQPTDGQGVLKPHTGRQGSGIVPKYNGYEFRPDGTQVIDKDYYSMHPEAGQLDLGYNIFGNPYAERGMKLPDSWKINDDEL